MRPEQHAQSATSISALHVTVCTSKCAQVCTSCNVLHKLHWSCATALWGRTPECSQRRTIQAVVHLRIESTLRTLDSSESLKFPVLTQRQRNARPRGHEVMDQKSPPWSQSLIKLHPSGESCNRSASAKNLAFSSQPRPCGRKTCLQKSTWSALALAAQELKQWGQE